MTNLKHVLSVALAAATLVAVLPFFIGEVLLLIPALAPIIVQAGIVPGTGPAWFVPAVPLGAVGLATAAFIVSKKQRSILVGGLLATGGILVTISSLIATGFLAIVTVPGPIIGVFIGLGIFGLGVAKSFETVKRSASIVR
jgi:hypothetical protein